MRGDRSLATEFIKIENEKERANDSDDTVNRLALFECGLFYERARGRAIH